MSTLRELIARATPGPWKVSRWKRFGCEECDGTTDYVPALTVNFQTAPNSETVVGWISGYPHDGANADLIARLNPQTMALVLDAIEHTITQINDAAAGKINFRGDFATRLESALAALNHPTP